MKNLTTDWNDGTLVAALVDALAPGLCPEHSIMDPKNAQQNASQAMKLAEDWLDVPQVSLYSSTLKGVVNIYKWGYKIWSTVLFKLLEITMTTVDSHRFELGGIQ